MESRRRVLFGNIKDPNFRETVKKAWIEVGNECAEIFPKFKGMSIEKLRDEIWCKKKAGVREKYDNSLRTGSGATKFAEVKNFVAIIALNSAPNIF